ncbi:MAG: bifunctional diaminohydroxyphosphoribosylaminopyrimidine deaminase/5-amino-6-(5-phosphoribosylamino)uracil reductase RibD [Planctomycetota bacterium]|nr:bifunctional diaminohydroxyphosphoribosylaminopyrimidine deaminase/5-amino-6-(5-phosphoribosylamino)uracil reductase RibD [Planctomycetota bacterium]
MQRALHLAAQARGRVEPNPLVGCVIVKSDRIIAEGYHHQFGSPHAEPTALAAATESPAGSTVYVTLEPCCHANKKTPPCTKALIQARVAKVIAACLDPNPEVSGKGLAQLQSAGIQTEVGLLEREAQQLNAPFFATTLHHRPYITLKWAQTADGKVAGPAGARLQITSPPATHLVHQLRGRCDAILVGINTVVNDDPLLLARHVETPRPLLRVVLDSTLAIPLTSQLVQSAGQSPVLILTSHSAHTQKPDHVRALTTLGVELAPLPADSTGHIPLPTVIAYLALRPITHLLVEPGPTLAQTFLSQNLADRIWIFRSPTQIGDPTAPTAIPVPYPPTANLPIGPDTLTEYLNPHGPVFFSATPSPDIQLIHSNNH